MWLRSFFAESRPSKKKPGKVSPQDILIARESPPEEAVRVKQWLRILFAGFLVVATIGVSGCNVVRFFASDENCKEKLQDASVCGAVVEKNFSNCKDEANATAVSKTQATGTAVLPDSTTCDNERGALQAVCWNTVRTRCL